ncbi:MAG: MFS transporter [Rhodospirillaceae bacterium]|nr:MFS transporter [Rhodospirillaceae bacterium]
MAASDTVTRPLPNPFLAVAAVIFGASILQVAHGLLSTLLPLRMNAAQATTVDIGLMATAYSTGFILGCLFVSRLIGAVGHIRVFAAFAAMASAVTLAFTIAPEPALWMAVRSMQGFAMAALFTVAESWLNERTPSAERGRVMAAYMVVTKLAFAGGQLSLMLSDIGGLLFFMAASAAFSLSLIPVAMTRAPSPKVPKLKTLGLRQIYRVAPAAAVGCFAIGLMNAAVINIGPLYGARQALSPSNIAALMAAMQIGSLLLQWPLGWISDRVDRRVIIVTAGAMVVVLSLAIAILGTRWPQALYVLFCLWGGFSLSIYAVFIAHANDFAGQDERVAVTSTLLLAWAVGSVIGPTAATLTMNTVGPAGLFYYVAAVATAMTGFVAYRMTRRPARPVDERARFVNVPASSPQLPTLDPRTARSGMTTDEGGSPGDERSDVD